MFRESTCRPFGLSTCLLGPDVEVSAAGAASLPGFSCADTLDVVELVSLAVVDVVVSPGCFCLHGDVMLVVLLLVLNLLLLAVFFSYNDFLAPAS